ncbi:hypothetical protein KKP04_11155 [Rhodomicrobium sp. Az07]|uniref:hypothetical protein n=1 Tax=Rhodomicrobium sp. Az07 TaxID=2839034 RepID=UPI001BEB2E6A|nr:hypothetical protein [Rhodomicrobium sp. Az07]MBT3071421.1 hypothetical protein [Rhodomicrobium sp. Az07]
MKALTKPDTMRFSIRLKTEKGLAMRALVEEGTYPNLNSAFNAAVDSLLEFEHRRHASQVEVARRCDEAHAERILG